MDIDDIKRIICEAFDRVKEDRRSFPQVGDKYYAIHNNGLICKHYWEQRQENEGRPVFNCFKTREDAQEFLERVKDVES